MREVSDALEAVDLLAQWRYPRAVSELEAQHSRWFAFFEAAELEIGMPRAVFWFGPAPSGPWPAHVSLHFWPAPHHLGHWTDEQIHAVEVIAQLLGAESLHAVYAGDPKVPERALKRYLRRKGWMPDDWGMCRELR